LNSEKIKQHIIDNDLISDILEKLDCHSIKQYSKEYRCALPNKTNSSAVAIKRDSLYISVYTEDESIKGDIFVLIMHLKQIKFYESLKLLHEMLNLKFEGYVKQDEVNKINPLDIFLKARSGVKTESNELKFYDKSLLDSYIKLPHIKLVQEGILPETQNKFNIAFSNEYNRIIFPYRHFYAEENKSYIGSTGRTIIDDYKLLDIPKYMAINKFPKTQTLYGLYENYEDIQKAGTVLVFESEKSVLKCDSYKIYNSVALGGHEISLEQEKILLGLNVEIVFCLDKDIKEDFIIKLCDRFKNTRKVSYILDKYDLLDEKSSPIDCGLKKFNYLLKYKINYGNISVREQG